MPIQPITVPVPESPLAALWKSDYGLILTDSQ